MIRNLTRPLTRGLTRALSPQLLDPVATIAVMGDSLSGGPILQGNAIRLGGYIWPILSRTNNRVSLIANSSGSNFNTGGFTAEQVRDTWLPAVIAAAPDACVFMVGTNNLASVTGSFRPDLDSAADSVMAVIAEIITALRTAGIVPIVCTITPDKFPTNEVWPPASGEYHPDYRTVRAKINDLIRAQHRSLGAIICDWSGVISTDPSDDTALADGRYMFDDVHFYASGAQQLGDLLAAVIEEKTILTGNPFDIPASNSPKWLTGNPYMEGNTSGRATGWDVFTTGVTVTNSKTAEGWQRITCSDGPDPGTTNNFRLTRFVQSTGADLDSRLVRGLVEIYPAESGFELWHADCRVDSTNLDDANPAKYSAFPGYPSGDDLRAMGALWVRDDKYFFLTPPMETVSGTGSNRRRLTITTRFYGRGTFDIRVCGVIDVTPE
jgi:lysophospholipase L1-like esterase